MVSDLIDSNSDRLALVEYHINSDGYDTPWGQDRADSFYSSAGLAPFLIYDGSWEWPVEDFDYGLQQRLADSTDVSVTLSASQVQGAQWQVSATVCVEQSGRHRSMRIYTVQLLDHWPATPTFERHTFKQAADTTDVELDPGGCTTLTSTFQFDADSWADPDDIKIVAWAQDPAATWPADVYQAAQMGWPFPNAQPAEPELPRAFRLPTPLFTGAGSAWVQEATAAAVLAASDSQLLATYKVLCGDTTGLFPVGQPPTGQSPFPTVASNEDSLPIFAAGTGQQEVLLCDYHGERSYPNSKWGISSQGGPVPVPACDGTVRPAGPVGPESNGWLVLYDQSTGTEYDFWQATDDRQAECQSRGAGRTGSSILEAGQADFSDVHGEGANPHGVAGARASGMPLLAGMLVPEDVEAGVIAHALAVAIPRPRNLSSDPSQPLSSDAFYPAASTEPSRYSTNPDALAAGQRLRLRSSLVNDSGRPVNETGSAGLAPITQLLVAALRTYGAYVVGDADRLTFYAEDIHTAVLALDDGEINRLIGQPTGMPLPSDKTRWQLVVEKLDQDLAGIPFAYGSCAGSSSVVHTPNFDVVEPVADPHACTPPTISTEPQGATVASGASVTLSVVASGTEPLTYQWYRGGSGSTADPIAGATAATYATPALDASASFWVRVSNDCGSADSSAATVTVTQVELPFVYLIPAVAHAPGVGGTLWRTDVAAINPGGAAAMLRLDFYPASGDESLTTSLSLAAGATVEWGNIMESIFSRPADAVASGSVAVASSAPLLLGARTYNQTPEGTYGQNLPALAPGELLTSGALGYLPGVKSNAAYRTNLGVVNTGEDEATIEARIYDGDGTQVGNPVSATVAPKRWYQVNNLFGAAGAGSQDVAYATVTVAESSVWAYASVVDNRSGDGTTVPLLVQGAAHGKRLAAGPDPTYLIPAVAHSPGVGGTLWRTDVAVVNPSAAAATLQVEYYPASGGEPLTTSLSLAAGAAVEWGNIIESVFSQPAESVASGSLEVESSAPLFLASRTYNQTPSGTFGQNLPALEVGGEALVPGQLGYLPGVKSNTAYRTNFGVINIGEDSATVEARVFDASGNQVGSAVSATVTPNRWYQVNNLFGAAGAGSQDVAYASVTVTAGSVWAYASVVDNRSGDGTTVPVLVLQQR